MAWPNPGCPVMMVECEHGMEERSLGGQVNLARSPAQTPGAAQGSSYFNREEAILAIRHASLWSSQPLKDIGSLNDWARYVWHAFRMCMNLCGACERRAEMPFRQVMETTCMPLCPAHAH